MTLPAITLVVILLLAVGAVARALALASQLDALTAAVAQLHQQLEGLTQTVNSLAHTITAHTPERQERHS